MEKYLRFLKYKNIGFLFITFILSACAERLPVPGGSDTVNATYYITKEDLLHRVDVLHADMREEEVFATLGHNKQDLIQLERDQIVMALYGSTMIDFRRNLPDSQDTSNFLQSLYGYRLNYKIVERQHGFSSPIRIQTNEKGFDYTLTLVFRNNKLYASPVLSGGIVNRSSSKTFFDYLNPGTIMNNIPNR